MEENGERMNKRRRKNENHVGEKTNAGKGERGIGGVKESERIDEVEGKKYKKWMK